MKILQARPVTIVLVLIAVSLTIIYAALRIPSTEGFNPSDDGVILAQSYRILNGEIPHRDFISIRPAGSAVMHAINYFSPLPLELSSRWLVWFEFLFTSILLTSCLAGSWFKVLRKPLFLLVIGSSVVVMFILNQNHYNLFPWTTIDALFWFSLALYGWYKLKNNPAGKHRRWQVLVFFAATLSLLCRQTFALPSLLLLLRMILWETGRERGRWKRNLFGLMLSAIIGLMPGWIYMAILTGTGSWPDFIQQLSGRTELWETGFARFYHTFWHSPLLVLYGLALISGLIKMWIAESGRITYWIDLVIMIQKLISFLVKVALVFLVFLKPDQLFAISFLFFWILVLDVFLIYLNENSLPRWTWPVFWILLASWTSAISLGDNAPVFATGWLAGTAMLMQIKDFRNRIYRHAKPYQWIAALILVPLLFVLSLNTQRKVNYRDLPANRLTHDGGAVFTGLAGISISPDMSAYLTEIKKLYQDFGSPAGRFAVLPNNALIYPLLDTRNPFPLDWMQAAEFVGSEERLNRSVGEALNTKQLVVLVEKLNVKWIAGQGVPVESRSADYPYLHLLDSLAVPVDVESRFFKVYRTK